MKQLMKIILVVVAIVPALAFAAGINDVTVMALGALDGRAVVKAKDGKMHVLKVGDAVPGATAVVTQVLADKLVVEETIEKSGQAPTKQTAWILKPTKAGEVSTVQRLDRAPPAKAPVMKPVTSGGAQGGEKR